MFDHTKAAFHLLVKDLKKIGFGLSVFTQLVTIAYLIYNLTAQKGVTIANAIMLTICTAYFIFFLYAENKHLKKETKKRISALYKWGKRLTKLFTILVVAYGLIVSGSDFSPFSFFLLIMMIFGWLLNILFYIIEKYVTAKIQLIWSGIVSDTKPVLKVVDFVEKFKNHKGIDLEISEEHAATLTETKNELQEKKKAQKKQDREAIWQNFKALFRKKEKESDDEQDEEQEEDLYDLT